MGTRMLDNIQELTSNENGFDRPLYMDDNNKLFFSDFVDSLKSVGINRSDVIFVHSDISAFGKLCVFDREFLFDILIDAMKMAVGEDGTIIMPTFTYSFCKNQNFDITNSKSIVGVLTEHFRKQPAVCRTNHPIFSVAIWGKYKKQLLQTGKDSFDKDSIFWKLHHLNGKIVFFGAPFQSCTYIHYIEQSHGVPYRFIKSFKGKIKGGNREHLDVCTYFVRHLDRNIITDLSRLERYLLEMGYMREVRLGSSKILMIEADILFNEGTRLLEQDINFFLNKAPE